MQRNNMIIANMPCVSVTRAMDAGNDCWKNGKETESRIEKERLLDEVPAPHDS
jgi:hypothetical protein